MNSTPTKSTLEQRAKLADEVASLLKDTFEQAERLERKLKDIGIVIEEKNFLEEDDEQPLSKNLDEVGHYLWRLAEELHDLYRVRNRAMNIAKDARRKLNG